MSRMRVRSRARNDDLQLDLFSLKLPCHETVDAVWPDGRETLARVPAEDGGGSRSKGAAPRDVIGSGRENGGGNGRDSPQANPAGPDAPAGPRPGLGDSAGEIHLPPTGVVIEDIGESPLPDPEPARNERNYRITENDKLGAGSLRRKCADNLKAIELLKVLEAEGRFATAEEKQVLVRFVGWGALPQVFDQWNDEWKGERERLEKLLTPDELDSARATTLNAHYTAPLIIRAMFGALSRFGFERGRILEPACGLGHDVAISNIPFGDYRPHDLRFKKWSFVIHDYFFAAALEKIRPGGLILFITSRGTFDKVDGAMREYVSQKADLIGAIRLPNDAFKKNANTEVTTDIVMLRKRLPGEPPEAPEWKMLVETENSKGEKIPINEYFAAHPEMMLGEMRLTGRMYRNGEPTLVSNGRDLSEQLSEAVALLPKDVFRPVHVRSPSLKVEQMFPVPEHIKPNAFAVLNGELSIRDGDKMRMVTGLPAQTVQRIRGLVRVRDSLRRCLRAQLEGTDESDVVSAREQLNQTYDYFVGKFGPISERGNAIAFRADPDLPLLLSLEHYDGETGRATKAAIFRERTVQRFRLPPKVDTANDALLVTLSERGFVDLEYLGGLLHRKPKDFLPDLKGTIFLNPQTNRWETEDE